MGPGPLVPWTIFGVLVGDITAGIISVAIKGRSVAVWLAVGVGVKNGLSRVTTDVSAVGVRY